MLGENVAVAGAPYQLVCRSDCVAGKTSARTATIFLLDETVPTGLIGIELQLQIAGRMFKESFPPNPNQELTFTGVRAMIR